MLRCIYEAQGAPGMISDVSDGELFERFLFLLGPGDHRQNIVLSLCAGRLDVFLLESPSCVDGVNVTKKGQYSVWLVTATIQNFPFWYDFILLWLFTSVKGTAQTRNDAACWSSPPYSTQVAPSPQDCQTLPQL